MNTNDLTLPDLHLGCDEQGCSTGLGTKTSVTNQMSRDSFNYNIFHSLSNVNEISLFEAHVCKQINREKINTH